ncbi:MAG: RDD family protein, partial [Wenzhouxiangellaceae bacterium]
MISAAETRCGIGRRLAAALYDGLLILALWMMGTLPLVIVSGADVPSGNWLFRAYLLALALGYLHLSWSRSGQTLGMRAWRIHVCPAQRSPRSIAASALRLGVGIVSLAALGLGFISALFRADRATWHDRASGTRLVVRAGQRTGPS